MKKIKLNWKGITLSTLTIGVIITLMCISPTLVSGMLGTLGTIIVLLFCAAQWNDGSVKDYIGPKENVNADTKAIVKMLAERNVDADVMHEYGREFKIIMNQYNLNITCNMENGIDALTERIIHNNNFYKDFCKSENREEKLNELLR